MKKKHKKGLAGKARRLRSQAKSRNDDINVDVRPPADPHQLDARFEYGEVRVDDVLIRPDQDEPDDDVVRAIAESPSGPFTPIIVRRVPPEQQGLRGGNKVELIAGMRRFQAARLRGTMIRCMYFNGTEKAARIIRIEEDLFRKHFSKLLRAELLAEWADLLPTIGYRFYGQVVQKRRGRPRKSVMRAMLDLPAIGRTAEARRKKIERARKIAAIAPQAKDVAKAGGLDNNQRALLTIASASGRKAQVRKAKELAGKLQDVTQAKAKAAPSKLAKGNPEQNGEDESPPLQPDSDTQTEGFSDVDGADDEPTSPQVPNDTTADELDNMWARAAGPKLWKYAPFDVRRDFMDKLDRAPYAAKGDVVEFIRKVFSGREKVRTRELYAYAKTKGILKKALTLQLRAFGYKLTKDGPHPAAPRAYRNLKWKEQLKVLPDAELEAPLAAEEKSNKQDEFSFLDELPVDPRLDKYYTDI